MESEFRLTGWHVFGIFAAAFGVIIGVNILLAVQAVSTFPGLEVKNSYVASQTFDVERKAQMALGWTVTAEPEGNALKLSIRDLDGNPVEAASLSGILGRATNVVQDQTPQWQFNGTDYLADTGLLATGNWNLRLKATAQDGTPFHQRVIIHVK